MTDLNSSTSRTLCWFEKCPRSRVRPVRTLEQMLAQANQDHSWGDSRANLVRLNWMVQDLRSNPLRKPLLVDNDWRIIVGDTRLMAIDLLGWTQVPVLAQLEHAQGTVIVDRAQLQQVLGYHELDILVAPPQADLFRESVTWAEFNEPGSQYHMHDHEARDQQMARWLAQQPPGHRFTHEWCLEAIDWAEYSD